MRMVSRCLLSGVWNVWRQHREDWLVGLAVLEYYRQRDGGDILPFMNIEKILLIRRDNIGDLVCTTPMFEALRRHYPQARIDVLVNSYNGPVIAANPYIDHIYSYTKAKHRTSGESVLRVHLRRLLLLWQMRRRRYDVVVAVGAGYLPKVIRMARLLRPRQIIAFAPPQSRCCAMRLLAIDSATTRPLHEVEDVYRLLLPLDVTQPPPASLVVPDVSLVAAIQARLPPGEGPWIGVHISSRRPNQRWPVESFVALMRTLHQRHGVRFILLWSPGAQDNPFHPGDDEKAVAIIAALPDMATAVYPCPTQELAELIAALALCQCVICSDGGAMHVAAGLGKPIVCFFGGTDTQRWHPWQVAHVLLQKTSQVVADITPEEAVQAYESLALHSEDER